MHPRIWKFAALVAVAVTSLVSRAHAVPATVSFTGRLSTANGPVSGNVPLTVTLYTQALGGTSVWSEDRASVAANEGLVYVELGALTTLDESVLGNGPLYLEVAVSGEVLSPRLPLQSVPYAIRAEVANSADTLGTIAPGEVVTAVTGGAGITATRSGNTVTLGASNATWQARVTGACAAGSSIASISATGGVTCEPDTDTNTTYSAAPGGGLALAGTAFGLTTCPSGQILRSTGGGAWSCGADANTTYTAAAGGGVSINASNQISLTSCAAGAVLRMGTGGQWACSTDPPRPPSGYAETPQGGGVRLDAAGVSLIAVGTVAPTRDGFCTVNVVSNTVESSPSGWSALAGGYRIGAGGITQGMIGDLFTASAGVGIHTASNAFGFPVSAGTTYSVGCVVNIQSGSSFIGNTYACGASWHCT